MSLTSTSRNETPLKVLVVEDSVPFAKLIVARLQRGLSSANEVHHVDCVGKGVEALRETQFDLIVLDMYLPDAEGMDTFQAIYKVAPDVPIVILSSDEDEQLAMSCVQHGAQDYLIKGKDDGHKLMWSIKFAIERKKRLHAEGELHAARRIQQNLLPEADPVVNGYEVHGAMFPAVEMAGDYFDFLVPISALGPDTAGIAVGDVSGHGLAAAMVMAETRGCLRSFAMVEGDLTRLFSLTNQVLVRNRNEHFVTLFLGYVHEASRLFRYVSAGHEAWHLLANGENIKLDSTGTVLGILEDATWTAEQTAPMSEGDFILITTDGITEAMSPTDELFGADRLCEFIRKHKEKSPREIVGELREHVGEFTGGAPAHDDMTMVIVKVLE